MATRIAYSYCFHASWHIRCYYVLYCRCLFFLSSMCALFFLLLFNICKDNVVISLSRFASSVYHLFSSRLFTKCWHLLISRILKLLICFWSGYIVWVFAFDDLRLCVCVYYAVVAVCSAYQPFHMPCHCINSCALSLFHNLNISRFNVERLLLSSLDGCCYYRSVCLAGTPVQKILWLYPILIHIIFLLHLSIFFSTMSRSAILFIISRSSLHRYSTHNPIHTCTRVYSGKWAVWSRLCPFGLANSFPFYKNVEVNAVWQISMTVCVVYSLALKKIQQITKSAQTLVLVGNLNRLVEEKRCLSIVQCAVWHPHLGNPIIQAVFNKQTKNCR